MQDLSIFSGLLKELFIVGVGLPPDLRDPGVFTLLALSLLEDLYDNLEGEDQTGSFADNLAAADITSHATLPTDQQLHARIIARQCGVIAGIPVCETIFKTLDSSIQFKTIQRDGTRVHNGDLLAELSGSGRALLAGERTALNFMGSLSGTATLVDQFVTAVQGTGAQILDTRKTTPGHRRLQKYAVRMGGGVNHRMGLYDMILIKNNHIDGAGGIRKAVSRVRDSYGDRFPIEVEVRNLDELRTALELDLSCILLDNMSSDLMRQAVFLSGGRTPLEASGNVSLQNVREIAETGVDYISIGALTHSAPNFDVSLRLS